MNAVRGVLVDTNILSFLLRRSPIGTYYEQQRAGRLGYVACATPEELYFGAEKKKWGARRRRELDALIAEYGVLAGDLETARISACIRAARERVGRALDKADAWIAATALDYGLPLFTHDGDFEGIEGLCIVTAPDAWAEGADEARSLGGDPTIEAAAIQRFAHVLQ